MKIKPLGVLVVLLIIGALAYFAISPRLSGGNQGSADTSTTSPSIPGSNRTTGNTADEPAASTTTTTTPAAGTSEDTREFNYSPEKPQNGTLRGVVEVGATGFNSFVINMDRQKRWEIVSKDFGESLTYEGLATTEDIRAGLKKYLAAMFDKGVANRNMHFVISSGAQKEPKTAIISNELKKMGYVVNNVTAEQEGKMGFTATVPPAFADNSFLVDIGSGNTKISWQENGRLQSIELPGAKYYEKGIADEQVYNQVKTLVAKIPASKRNVGFILGGVPFTLAKQHRRGEERYTVLKAPGAYKAADKKMGSGLIIYKGLAEATGTDTFVFDWDANFTIGFLLSLNQ
ncbi:hypothetical protein SAMN06265337_4181 [Hymenobacter gelipurpurascens]|uniref:Ppx/GppA phosphatase family protein n=1 Tax=Hymenobacter gelipurpurascens TaxID=89968 RepID=A0A212UH47_9BACT|nr:hypothetical protein [Hymenobacter gelipurpurascens]SNC77588.1 hypothetical protein SAMN06265337_4181 [Hymenobacter gelipurpurascens]